MKNLRAGLFGKLVAINGTVVRASNSKPVCLSLAFLCRTCSGVMTYPQAEGKYEQPTRCILEKDDIPCTGNIFEPLRSSPRNEVVEWQSIRIQEISSENLVRYCDFYFPLIFYLLTHQSTIVFSSYPWSKSDEFQDRSIVSWWRILFFPVLLEKSSPLSASSGYTKNQIFEICTWFKF